MIDSAFMTSLSSAKFDRRIAIATDTRRTLKKGLLRTKIRSARSLRLKRTPTSSFFTTCRDRDPPSLARVARFRLLLHHANKNQSRKAQNTMRTTQEHKKQHACLKELARFYSWIKQVHPERRAKQVVKEVKGRSDCRSREFAQQPHSASPGR